MSCQWGMVSGCTLSVVEVTPMLVGEAFYNGEVESELRRLHSALKRMKIEICVWI